MSEPDDIIAVSMGGFDTPSPKLCKIEFKSVEMKDMSNINISNADMSTDSEILQSRGVKIVPHSEKLQKYIDGDTIEGVIVFQECIICNIKTCVLDTWKNIDKICGNCEKICENCEKVKSKPLNGKILKQILSGDKYFAR